MKILPQHEVAEFINSLSLETTAAYVASAQKLGLCGASPAQAASIMLDVALVSAASFIMTALGNGAACSTLPVPQLLHQRLDELLAMPTRFHQVRPDGSFDPAGQTVQ